MAPKLRRRGPTALNGHTPVLNESPVVTDTPVVHQLVSDDNKSIDNMQRLKELSDDWFTFFDRRTDELKTTLDSIIETQTTNRCLEIEMRQLEVSRCRELVAIAANEGFVITGNITGFDGLKAVMASMRAQMDREKDLMKNTLKDKKKEKTTVEKRLKSVSKLLDELMAEKRRMEGNGEEREAKELARIMRLKYKVTQNQRSVMFDFEDRKRSEKLISSDSEDISRDFWSQLNKRYNI